MNVKLEGKEINCIIRKTVLNDADDLFALVKKFATSFKPKKEKFEASLKYLILDKSTWLSVAEYNKKIVGYCLGFDHFAFYANGRVSWVEEIMVQDEFRRKGIGSALMEAFEEWAESRESRLVGLATRRATPFYSTLKYENSAIFFRKLL